MGRLLFLAVLIWSYPALAAETLTVRPADAGHYRLAPHFQYVEDRAGRLTIADLTDPSSRVLFSPVPGNEVNFGYSRSVYWLRATVLDERPAGKPLFLEIAYPTLDRVTVFLAEGSEARLIAEAGDLQPFASRPVHHRNLVFPLDVPAGRETALFIRVESEGSLTVPASLWKEDAFDGHSREEYAVHSAYFGLLAALILYNFLLFLSLREAVYLAYVCFVGAMAVGQLSQTGLGNEYLWPGFTAWGNIAFPVGFAATGFFGALFTRLFLDTRRSTPRLDRVITVLAAGFAFAVLSPAFISYRATAVLTSLLGISFSVTAVAAGIICQLRGHPGARFFLLAWTLLLAGVAVLGMRNFAWVPTTFVTSYGMQIGSALETLLLSFALADRINHTRREKDEAQQQALRVAQEKEKELHDKAREWEETFSSISDMIVILDRDCRVIKANRAAAEFLGSDPAGLSGRKCHHVNGGSGCLQDACPSRQTLDEQRTITREIQDPRTQRTYEVSTSPLVNSKGSVDAVVQITKDVTWRKKVEEELVRTEKLDSLAVLAGGIAHDFNNMLTIIMSTTTLAKMYAKDDPKVVAKIEEAEQEIIRTRELTAQLLTFAKGGAPVKRLASFPDLLRDTVEFSLKGSNAGCTMIISDDLWAAEIDATQISQVLSNLVINAVQAMPDGGEIRVNADNVVIDGSERLPLAPGRYLRIAIEDTGRGIAPSHLPYIFDPFFTTKAGGSGLGLSTCYSVVKKHNGFINVMSRAGAGSIFTVYLPASSDTPVKAVQALSEPETRGAGRVLLMDDDGKILKNVSEMLERLGYEVETARNGDEAIILYKRAMVLSQPFAAVVLDVMVAGGMGGKDCIGHLMDLDPGVKAVVMSGNSEDAVLAEYGPYGFQEGLSKPFTADELHRRLRGVIAGKEREHA